MTAFAAGDRSAFEFVFASLWPLLRKFCQRALRDPTRAEDAAQSALMNLFLHSSEFRADGDAVAWAFGFATHACLTARNRVARRREEHAEVALAALPGAQPSPEEATIDADLRAAALEVMESLRPADEAALRWAVDGSGEPQGAAFRKRLQRARERLRTAWRYVHESD